MAEPLKRLIDSALIATLEQDLVRAGRSPGDFVAEASQGLDDLELLARADHVARAMRRVLPTDPAAALRSLVATLGPPHATDELLGTSATTFRYLPHSALVAELGVLEPEVGLWACRELTRRFTAEFCIRPLLVAHPERTWAALDTWIDDPDPHVRRLVSEGLRPRLPWATRLELLRRDPTPALRRLDRLVDDPASLVRRSVANHLGDIAKDHPELAVDTAARWLAGDRSREPLVRHALRHLVKLGHPGALRVLGHVGAEVRVHGFEAPPVVTLGDTVEYSFVLSSTHDAEQELLVDAVVSFPKAGGKRSAKVFKLGTVTLAAGASRRFAGKVRLHDMSTRTHYPGVHEIGVQVNGVRLPGGSFEAR